MRIDLSNKFIKNILIQESFLYLGLLVESKSNNVNLQPTRSILIEHKQDPGRNRISRAKRKKNLRKDFNLRYI